MRHFDLSPLFRASVGFDQITEMIERLASDGAQSSYPPYNIEKTADNAYRISIAVAGFAAEDLSVEIKNRALVISGRKPPEAAGRAYLHRGIANRAFQRRFHLADHVRVAAATQENGMLHVDLKREMPETLKPRTIPISAPGFEGSQIESAASAH